MNVNEEKKDTVIEEPDIPQPTANSKPRNEKIEDEMETAYRLAFVGIGQGGSRIVESFHKLGYNRVCCINTTQQDLTGINIPEANKLVMDVGEGGARKDLRLGEDAVSKYHESIHDLMKRSFGNEFDRIIVCVGTGGGTGAGGCYEVINIAHDLAKSMKLEDSDSDSAVGAIAALPKNSEGAKVCQNAHYTVDELFHLTEGEYQKSISPLIAIDNEKIDEVYPNLPVKQFWEVANKNISGLFHLFNSIACKDSEYTTFDKADLGEILNAGAITFGACPVQNWENETDISAAVRDNLTQNVLVGDYDLQGANVAACVFIGSGSILDEIPQNYLEHGFDMLTRIMGTNSTVHRGIYEGNSEGLTAYTIMAGLSKPSNRLAELRKLGNA